MSRDFVQKTLLQYFTNRPQNFENSIQSLDLIFCDLDLDSYLSFLRPEMKPCSRKIHPEKYNYSHNIFIL